MFCLDRDGGLILKFQVILQRLLSMCVRYFSYHAIEPCQAVIRYTSYICGSGGHQMAHIT